MTPKEKAQELYDKIHFVLPSVADEGQQEHRSAKQCALITVDELISIAQDDVHFKHTEFTETHSNYKSYWKLVKQEIEKI